MSNAPQGIGVFCRMLTTKTHGTPAQLAKKLKDNGLSYAAFLACWQDRQGPNKTDREFQGGTDAVTKQYVDACKAAGIDAWLWGFPRLRHEDAYMARMAKVHAAMTPGSITGLIHDVEVSYRDKNAKIANKASRGQGEAIDDEPEGDASAATKGAIRLMELDRAYVKAHGLRPSGMSSYGMENFHPMPWDVLADGGRIWGSPQLYTVTPKQVDIGLSGWDSHHYGGLVPAIPGYGPNSAAALDEYLGCFVDSGNEPTIDGFIVWSYQQISGVEWATLKKWAQMLRDRACKAPT